MAHKTKKQIVQRILQLIESQPRTINELAESVGSNWDTVYKALTMLKSIGLVQEVEESSKRMFKKKEGTSIIRRPDTLFGVPISKECENLCYSLFIKVKEKWTQKTKNPPNKTQMQKVVAEIADNIKMPVEIPRGWYLFGQVCVLEYDPNKEYETEFKGNIPKLNEELDKAVEIYSKYSNTLGVLFEQYQRKNKTLYLARLKLSQVLDCRIEQKDKPVISSLLYSLVMNFPEKEDNKDVTSVLNSYVSIINQILMEKDEKSLEDLHMLIEDSFISLWELMATYNLFNDLVSGNYGYEYNTLKDYFNPRVETLMALCKEYLEELNGTLLPKHIDKDSKLFKLMGSMKELSTEEKKKREKELERIREEEGEEGLQKFLLKKFGLD